MKRKIISLITAAVLVCACVFGLTGCSISNEEYKKQAKAVAKDYYASHKDYEKFDDINIKYTAHLVYTSENDYFEDARDMIDSVLTYEINVQNVGEEILFSMVFTENDTSTYCSKEPDGSKKENVSKEFRSKTQTYFIKGTGDDAKYGIFTDQRQKEDDEEEVVVKTVKYFVSDDARDVYVDHINDLLDDVNDNIISEAFFEFSDLNGTSMAELYKDYVKTSKDNKDYVLEVDIDSFEASEEYSDNELKLKVIFSDGKVASTEKSEKETRANNTYANMEYSCTVAYSASVAVPANFDDYTLSPSAAMIVIPNYGSMLW